MEPRPFGSFILVEAFSESSLGTVYKALPQEGEPDLVYLHAVSEEVVRQPAASTLLLTHAQRWKELRDLHALNLLEFGQAGESLYYTFERSQGRILSDVLKRCATEGIPLAHDQAVYLANRVAAALLSLSTAGVFAGYLAPERILVTFEGEVKLLPCILRDLQTTLLRESDTLGPYLAHLHPNGRAGKPSKSSWDRYAVGLLFFEFLCREPFYTGEEAFDPAARLLEAENGIGMADGLPESLMAILRKSLLPEAPDAYADLDALKADLDALITSGQYSPTTFNIAFLMHSLFRGEDEAEDARDQGWVRLDREAYRPEPEPEPEPEPPPPPPPPSPAPPPKPEAPTFSSDFGVEPEPSKKGLYFALGAAALVVLGIVVGVFLFRRGPSEADIKAQVEQQVAAERAKLKEQQDAIAKQLADAQAERQALEDRLAGAKTTEEKQKAAKALEDAKAKIAAQEKQQAALAAQAQKVETPPQPAPSQPKPEVASSQPAKPAEPASQPTAEPAPPPSQPAPQPAPEPARSPEPTKVQRGDFVESWALDVKPKPDKEIKADYTSLARQNRAQGRVTLEIAVDESGRATSAQVLRGLNPDYGIHDALVKAALATKFSPGMKDGVPVKTKYVVNLNYAMR